MGLAQLLVAARALALIVVRQCQASVQQPLCGIGQLCQWHPLFAVQTAQQRQLRIIQHHRTIQMGRQRRPLVAYGQHRPAIAAEQRSHVQLQGLQRLAQQMPAAAYAYLFHWQDFHHSFISMIRSRATFPAYNDMTDNDPNQGPPSLDPAQAEVLLDRLANDEAFRQLFCSDGPAALAAIGYHGPTESKACFKVEKLASPQELIAARDALRQALTDKAQMSMSVVFFFEAGKISQRLKKR